MSFEYSLNNVLGHEGGYVNSKFDRGGETNYGITKETARAFGYTGSMVALPLEFAKEVYRKGYWTPIQGDALDKVHPLLADHLFDIAVNMGPGAAGKQLQEALNILNNRGTIYPDLVVDGMIGKGTLGALNAYVAKRGAEGVKVLILYLVSQQSDRYKRIAINDQSQEANVYGWFRRSTEKLQRFARELS